MKKRRPSGDCPNCGTWRYSLHRDHIIAKWKGGIDEESNCQYICANCHEDKTRQDLLGHTCNRGIKRPSYKRLGRHTPEHCAAISKALTGRIVSAETRAKISAKRLGVKLGPRSEAYRENCRRVRNAWWAAASAEVRQAGAVKGWETRRSKQAGL